MRTVCSKQTFPTSILKIALAVSIVFGGGAAGAQTYNASNTLGAKSLSAVGGSTAPGQYNSTGNFQFGGVIGGSSAGPTITSATGSDTISVAAYNPIAAGNAGLALGSITITLRGGTSSSFIPTSNANGWSVSNEFFTTSTVSDAMSLQLFAPGSTTAKLGGTSTVTGVSPGLTFGFGGTVTANQTAANWTTAGSGSFTTVSITLLGSQVDLSPYEKRGGGTVVFDLAALAADTISSSQTFTTDASLFTTDATVTISGVTFVPEPSLLGLIAGLMPAVALYTVKKRRQTIGYRALGRARLLASRTQ